MCRVKASGAAAPRNCAASAGNWWVRRVLTLMMIWPIWSVQSQGVTMPSQSAGVGACQLDFRGGASEVVGQIMN